MGVCWISWRLFPGFSHLKAVVVNCSREIVLEEIGIQIRWHMLSAIGPRKGNAKFHLQGAYNI